MIPRLDGGLTIMQEVDSNISTNMCCASQVEALEYRRSDRCSTPSSQAKGRLGIMLANGSGIMAADRGCVTNLRTPDLSSVQCKDGTRQ